jgi:RimJ/RimL family protein N-acetyltransferase
MAWIEPVTLRGNGVTLEPLTHAHHDDLVEAVGENDAWRQWTTSVPAPGDVRADIDRRLAMQAAGNMIPFAVLDHHTGRAVGCTSYWEIDAPNRHVEIGWTSL